MALLHRDGRLRRAGRWLAPSVAAAAWGALAAGAIELLGEGTTGGPLGVVATVGFVALLLVPVLLVASVVARAVIAAWDPARLRARLVEDGGGAPLLAAWAILIWLASFGVALALFAAVWRMAGDTWQAAPVSFAMPIVAVGSTLLALATAWPAVRGLAWLLRRADARWRSGGRRSLITPARIAVGVAAITAVALATIWLGWLSGALGPFDLTLFVGPGLAAALAVAVHATRHRVPARARRTLGAAAVALVGACLACALIVARTAPIVTLSIWGDRPIAGYAIDKLYDLDRLRGGISIAELAPTVARPGAPHPDIIFITIDTVRSDHTPPYGGHADMPTLAHLAETGAVFEWAFSPSNVTRRSIPSMVIGLQPNRVHGRVVGWALRVDPRHVLLAERLREGGYDTAGFMCCEGFWGTEFHTGLERGLTHLEIEKNGVELAKRARTWLDAREHAGPRKPLFVWMHLLEPHNWTNGADEPRSEVLKQQAYDRSLAISDSAVATLLGAFGARAPEQMPIVIVTADHGEALGDHGHAFHSTDLYDSQIHVPLVMSGPGIPVHRIPETVSLVDLVPTMMDLAGFLPPDPIVLDGHSIADLATGARASVPDGGEAFAAQIKDRSNPGGITTVVRGRWKLLSDNSVHELYDTRADVGELHNLVDVPDYAALAREMAEALARREARGHTSPFP